MDVQNPVPGQAEGGPQAEGQTGAFFLTPDSQWSVGGAGDTGTGRQTARGGGAGTATRTSTVPGSKEVHSVWRDRSPLQGLSEADVFLCAGGQSGSLRIGGEGDRSAGQNGGEPPPLLYIMVLEPPLVAIRADPGVVGVHLTGGGGEALKGDCLC